MITDGLELIDKTEFKHVEHLTEVVLRLRHSGEYYEVGVDEDLFDIICLEGVLFKEGRATFVLFNHSNSEFAGGRPYTPAWQTLGYEYSWMVASGDCNSGDNAGVYLKYSGGEPEEPLRFLGD